MSSGLYSGVSGLAIGTGLYKGAAGLWGNSSGLISGWGGFSPIALFTAGIEGFWYDISDFSTLYQDAAGTVPVTAVGQTVGLVLDKSRGLVLGPELVANGDFSNGGTGWAVTGTDATHIVTFSSGTARYQSDTTTPALSIMQTVLTLGKFYRIEVKTSAWVSGSVKIESFGYSMVIPSGVGTTVFYGTAASTNLNITRAVANVDLTIDNISVRELPGNHASQSVLASRPILQQDANGKFFLLFDGSDDFLVTPTITPGTDKAQVFAGLRKLSDAAIGMVVETSGNAASGNAIQLRAPGSVANTYMFGSAGSISQVTAPTGFTAPITNVLSGLGDISGDRAILRANGAQVGQNTADQGTGNYLAYPAYIGRRGGTTLPFNGRIYGLIARFGPNLSDVQIAQTEQWMNSKTGAY